MDINWGLLNDNSFQNALAMGHRMGQGLAQARQEGQLRNALIDYDPSNPESWKGVAKANPKLGFELREQQMKHQQDREKLEREKALEAGKYVADQAFYISSLPPEQQAMAWDSAIEQGVGLGFQNLAQYRGQYTPERLRGLVAQAGQMRELLEQQQPKYMAIPEGGTLVDTRNPGAVQQFGGQAQAPQQQGAPMQVRTPDEYAKLEPGAQYIAPDGSIRTKVGGVGSNVGPTFLDGL